MKLKIHHKQKSSPQFLSNPFFDWVIILVLSVAATATTSYEAYQLFIAVRGGAEAATSIPPAEIDKTLDADALSRMIDTFEKRAQSEEGIRNTPYSGSYDPSR